MSDQSTRRSTIDRRRFLATTATGATAAALAVGARPGSAATERGASRAASRVYPRFSLQGDPIELTYWHGWTEQWEDMVQFVVDQFNASQSRIVVKPEVVPWTDAGAEFLAKLTASIAAGDPPGLVTLFGSTAIPTLASQGAIVALDDIDGALDGVQDWMDPNVFGIGGYEGKTYGLSYWAGCSAIIYNKAHFREAGLDPEVGPATVADLDAMVDQLTIRDGDGNIERMGFSTSDLWLWGTIYGGDFYDEAERRITANDPNIVRALEWIQSYPEKFTPGAIATFEEGLASERAANLDPLIAGKFAITTQGPWKLGDIRNFADESFEYGVSVLPRETAEAPLGNWTWGDIQIIPAGGADPSAAAEFVRFTAGVGDPEGYAERCTWGGRPINIPVSRQVLEVPAFQQVVAEFPGFQVFIDALLTGERVGYPPVMAASAFYANRMVSTVERVKLMEIDPEPALNELTEEVQRELDRS